MASEYFEMEIVEGVASCTMKGPKMNAMGAEMLPDLLEGLEAALDSDRARVIVLRGSEGNFCTGADVSTLGEEMNPEVLFEGMMKAGEVFRRLHMGDKPVITEVDGWAVGGGFGLALASDITYATERARFLMSFVRISIIPDLGSSYFLTRRVGQSVAKEMALTGKVVDAEEAHRIGMVNRIINHEEITGKVMEKATRMATRPLRVLSMTKRNMSIAGQVDLQTMLEMEASLQPFFVLSPEHQKDVEAFFNRKKEE